VEIRKLKKESRKSDFKSKIPNPDGPEPKEKLITKARKYENTKKKSNFVFSKFRGFVVKKFFHKIQKIHY